MFNSAKGGVNRGKGGYRWQGRGEQDICSINCGFSIKKKAERVL
jgi:hypothetical protein